MRTANGLEPDILAKHSINAEEYMDEYRDKDGENRARDEDEDEDGDGDRDFDAGVENVVVTCQNSTFQYLSAWSFG